MAQQSERESKRAGVLERGIGGSANESEGSEWEKRRKESAQLDTDNQTIMAV